ncbi:MAG: histidine phosphatase family protein [Puniceicoccaceae bacterium]
MKKLHLIRHAKSSWNHPGLGDVERPLNERGIRACARMARPIMEAGCRFEHVFCSVATRAQLTIEGIAASLPELDINWRIDESLYTFSARDLLNWVHRLDESLDEVIMVGHNPAMTEFSNAMGNGSISNMPTCGYAQLQFPVGRWEEVGPGTGTLEKFLAPKLLK